MIDLALSLYGTFCAVGYMGVSVFLALVSVFLFVCSVAAVAQGLERLLAHTGSLALIGSSHSGYGC